MTFLRNGFKVMMRIRTKLYLSYGAIVLLLISLSVLAVTNIGKMKEFTETLYANPYAVSQAMLRINSNIIKIHRTMKDVALAENISDIEKALKMVDAYEDDVYEDINFIKKKDVDDKFLVADLERPFRLWKPIREVVANFAKKGQFKRAANITKMEGAEHVVKLGFIIDRLTHIAKREAKSLYDKFEIVNSRVVLFFYVFCVGAIVIAVVLSFSITRRIARSIATLQIGTEIIGDGNLSYKVRVDSNDEIGQLAKAFNKMTSNLKGITASKKDLEEEIRERKKLQRNLQLKVAEIESGKSQLEMEKNAVEKIRVELERSNKELEQFAYVASHDLQEPLRKINSFGDILIMEKGDQIDDEGKDYLNRMQKAAKRMRALIDGLLAYSRVTTHGLDFKRVSTDRVVKQALEIMELKIRETEAEVTVTGDWFDVVGDELQLGQLFQNLISNALKYKKPDTKPKILINSTRINDNTIEIMVKDNGIGFDEQYADKIFAPFQRLNPVLMYEGSGIGLSICEKIVKRHQGTIKVKSEPGQGTVFFIQLGIYQ